MTGRLCVGIISFITNIACLLVPYIFYPITFIWGGCNSIITSFFGSKALSAIPYLGIGTAHIAVVTF